MTIKPTAGYILCRPYIKEDKVFKSPKETEGEDQISEVLEVGPDILDDKGIIRTTPVKKEDIIIHALNNSPIEIEAQLFRFVHFTQVHGIYKLDKRN